MKIVLSIGLLVCCTAATAVGAEAEVASRHPFEAETATLTGGAGQVADGGASGGALVSVKLGEGVQFTRVPQAGKLAIRYASVSVGTISITVNDQPARKVNVHFSGALTNSFLNAIIELAIPADATLSIQAETNDVSVNLDRIIVGNGDLGLPPDMCPLGRESVPLKARQCL